MRAISSFQSRSDRICRSLQQDSGVSYRVSLVVETTYSTADSNHRTTYIRDAGITCGGNGPALPFQSITFVDKESAIEFVAAGSRWKCDLTSYACQKLGPAGPGQRGGAPEDFSGLEEFSGGFNNLTLEPAPQFQQQQDGQRGQAQNQDPKASPDGKWEGFIKNFNVYIRPKGKTTDEVQLSFDGSEGNHFTLASLAWSPDSNKLAAYRVRLVFTGRFRTSNRHLWTKSIPNIGCASIRNLEIRWTCVSRPLRHYSEETVQHR